MSSTTASTTRGAISAAAQVLTGPPAPEVPAIMTVAEAAQILRVDHQVIRGAIKRGELPSIRAGRQHRIRRQDLSAYLRRGKAE